MGFRFSRRVSILPGLKLNFSGSGVSLSAGVRGAHINFGARGTYTSFGLPGTGLYYRQRVGGGRPVSRPPAFSEQRLNTIGDRSNDAMAEKVFREGSQEVTVNPEEARRYLADPRFKLSDPETGRRLTTAQIEARLRAAELKEKVENLQLQLQSQAEDYQHLLNFWKPLPEIAPRETWANAQTKRPFESKLAPPALPDPQAEQSRLLQELTAKDAASGLNKFLPAFVARGEARKELAAAWPARQAQLQSQYEEQRRQYGQQLAAESEAWDQAEEQRIGWVKRLLAGDLEEIHHTVAEVLQGLQFPFRTHCDFFLKDAHSVYLQLDLPELEEVIPETRQTILKSGQTREVRVPQAERNADYAHLAMGQCLYLAAEVLSYLPLAQVVQVAAYTQRPRVRESDPIDSYLLDVPFGREAVVGFGKEEQNLAALIARLGGRMKADGAGGLERIEPPSWLTHDDYRSLG